MQIWTFSKHHIFKYDFWEKTQYSNMNFWCFLVTPASSKSQFNQVISAATHSKFRGRQLLDHKGLSCLFILLFIDEKLNTTRLHRGASVTMPRPGTGWFVASSPSSRRQMLEVASLNNLLLEEDLLPAALRLRPPPPLSSLESPCQGRRRRRRQRRRKNVEEAVGVKTLG